MLSIVTVLGLGSWEILGQRRLSVYAGLRIIDFAIVPNPH